jgi:hypothetical protein
VGSLVALKASGCGGSRITAENDSWGRKPADELE